MGRNLLKKHERQYILRRSKRKQIWKLRRGYEIKPEMIDRIPEVTVRKDMHIIDYKDKSDFAIDPEPQREASFGSRMKLEWEMKPHTKYEPIQYDMSEGLFQAR